ncbi:MAG: EamA/RhaT family transporter [Salibacteraceae bacterium]
MLTLLFSILISSFLFVIFKLFEKFKVDNKTAIVFNYLVAFTIGAIIEGNSLVIEYFNQTWFWAALALGIVFFLLFTLIAQITQEYGVAVSVLANKMSLVIPVILAVLLLNEKFSISKGLGILSALIGIALTLYKSDSKVSLKTFTLPIVLFIGSGFLDFSLKLNQTFLLGEVSYFAFVATIFLGAFLFGLMFSIFKNQLKITKTNIIAGFGLGIPNFFSIYFLMKALNLPNMESTMLFPINNSGILLVSTLLGVLFFKEKLTLVNGIGILFCLIGIFSIAIFS